MESWSATASFDFKLVTAPRLESMPWVQLERGKKGQLAEGMYSLVIYGTIKHVLEMRRICAYRAAGVMKKSMFGYSNLLYQISCVRQVTGY